MRWELELANRERSGPLASWSEVVERWSAARRLFFVPSYTRVLAILSPTYDPRVDRIGFWRVVLPRPGWLMPRVQGYKRHPEYTDLPLDLVPDLPFGLWVLRELRRSPERLPEPWRGRELRVRSLSYSLLGIPRKQGPDRAFRDLRVTIELAAATAPDVLVLEADLHLDPDRDEPELHRLAQGQEAGEAATPGSRVAISPSRAPVPAPRPPARGSGPR